MIGKILEKNYTRIKGRARFWVARLTEFSLKNTKNSQKLLPVQPPPKSVARPVSHPSSYTGGGL